MLRTYSGTVSSNGIKTTKRKNTILYFLDPTICTAPSNIIMSSIYDENIDYEVDEYVTYNSKLYKCKQNHMSTSIFDAKKWVEQNEEIVPLSSFALSSYGNSFTFSIGEEHCVHNMLTDNDISYDNMDVPCIKIYETNVQFELNGQF